MYFGLSEGALHDNAICKTTQAEFFAHRCILSYRQSTLPPSNSKALVLESDIATDGKTRYAILYVLHDVLLIQNVARRKVATLYVESSNCESILLYKVLYKVT